MKIQAQVQSTIATVQSTITKKGKLKLKFPMDGLLYPITNWEITVDHPIYANENIQEPIKVLSVKLKTEGLACKYGFSDGAALDLMFNNMGIHPCYYLNLARVLLVKHAVPAAEISEDDVDQYITLHNPVRVKKGVSWKKTSFTITREDVEAELLGVILEVDAEYERYRNQIEENEACK